MKLSDLLANNKFTNRNMFYTEVADVFPVPTSGGLDFVSCILSIIFICTPETFILEQMIICVFIKNCVLFAQRLCFQL